MQAAYQRPMMPLMSASPTIAGSNFMFTFATLTGKTYTVQFKDSLAETNWQTLAPTVSGNGGNRSFTNAPPSPARFYRLLIQ